MKEIPRFKYFVDALVDDVLVFETFSIPFGSTLLIFLQQSGRGEIKHYNDNYWFARTWLFAENLVIYYINAWSFLASQSVSYFS